MNPLDLPTPPERNFWRDFIIGGLLGAGFGWMFHTAFMSAPGEPGLWVPMVIGAAAVGLLSGDYGSEFWDFLGRLFYWFKPW